MMEVISEVCRAFALTVSTKKTETMCMPPLRTPRTMVQVEAAGQTYVYNFHDFDIKNKNRVLRACVVAPSTLLEL